MGGLYSFPRGAGSTPAQRVSPGSGKFKAYAILGDDVVIADSRVAKEYQERLSKLEVKISTSKSLISNSGAFEFAKRSNLSFSALTHVVPMISLTTLPSSTDHPPITDRLPMPTKPSNPDRPTTDKTDPPSPLLSRQPNHPPFLLFSRQLTTLTDQTISLPLCFSLADRPPTQTPSNPDGWSILGLFLVCS
ncbi:hypothetical protein L484_006029 [Morus notabilis]|uniref:Uncharacterized protein n=1 Tax=Morus notabilis TaxID=981085 RepID=W9QP52_9ROSA|nr:hypothetical protein L484_006029 [Morus notabilis]